MTHGQRSAALLRSFLRASPDVKLDDGFDWDPMPAGFEPEPDHRSSLDALCHDGAREFLPADAFSFRSRP